MLKELQAAMPSFFRESKAFAELEAQAQAGIETRRAEAIAGLARIDGEWSEKIPPLEQEHTDTVEDVRKAREALEAAQRKQGAARMKLSGAKYPLDHRRDVLRNQLDGELCPPAIVAALAQLDQIEEGTRETSRSSGENTNYRSISARLEHIRSITRPALAELKFTPTTDLDKALRMLFSAIPEIN